MTQKIDFKSQILSFGRSLHPVKSWTFFETNRDRSILFLPEDKQNVYPLMQERIPKMFYASCEYVI